MIFPFFLNISMAPTLESDLTTKYIENIISNNNIEDESTLKRIIESVKKFN